LLYTEPGMALPNPSVDQLFIPPIRWYGTCFGQAPEKRLLSLKTFALFPLLNLTASMT
jgi:hypothetical protein